MEKNRMTICVDASCLGNPGRAEYRGLNFATKEVLFEYAIPGISTNNVAEFFAIVHALKYSKENKVYATIYSDSQTAIGWIKNKSCSTTLVRNQETVVSHLLIKNAKKLLNQFEKKVLVSMVKKWDTRTFGEIPADYGRKK